MKHPLPTALTAFAGIRVLGLGVLAAFADHRGMSAHARLVRWDAQWYASIAHNGYGLVHITTDGRHLLDYAFFPLYPGFESVTATLTGLTEVNAGLLDSAVASVAATVAIYLVGRRVAGERGALILVVLWAAVPVGIVESMAYSESLFTALAAWALWATLDERWFAAGLLACLAGATRPVGAAVVAAVVLTALSSVGADRRQRLAAVVIAPLGWLGYVCWVGFRRGSATGYFDVARNWHNGFDGGQSFVRWVAAQPWPLTVLIVAAVAAVTVLLVLSVRDRQPLPLLVYSVAMVVLAFGTSGYFGSKPRYLLPVFPLLLPIAVRLSRSTRGQGVVRAGLLVLALGSAIYGALWLLGPGPP